MNKHLSVWISLAMIKVKFIRNSLLTLFGGVKTYIFSTCCFFFVDFPSRVTCVRAEMVCKLLKQKIFCSHKQERLCARERRTRAHSRGHVRLLIPTTQEVRNSYNIDVIGLRNVQSISMN